MSLLALTLADFQQQLPFSNKIEESQIRPFIELAYKLDVLPLLGYKALEEIKALAPITVTPYAPDLTIALDGYYARHERIYKALAVDPISDVPVLPPVLPDPGEWGYEPLHTLWQYYLKEWWVQQAFARFLPQHGLNITKAGVTVPVDRVQGTYDRPSAADRASLQNSVSITADALRSRLGAFLRSETLLQARFMGHGYAYYEESACSTPSTSRRGGRFRAI